MLSSAGSGVTVTLSAAAPPLPALLATVDGSRPSATNSDYHLLPDAGATTATLTIAPSDPAFVAHCTQVCTPHYFSLSLLIRFMYPRHHHHCVSFPFFASPCPSPSRPVPPWAA